MAKSKRKPRSTNKIESSQADALIEVDPTPSDVPAIVYRSQAATITRSSIFTADFEAVIELIATERVRRAMLARQMLRLLAPPPIPPPLISD